MPYDKRTVSKVRWIYHIVKDNIKSTILLLVVSMILFLTAQSSLQGNNKFDIITVIITIITITVGFAAAALTMFLGITDKPVILRIRKRHAVIQLVNYFKDLIYFGGIVIILSIIISLYSNREIIIWGFSIPVSDVLLYSFIFSTMASLYYAYRLINIILRVFQKLVTEE